jgi:hypothetical protein
MAVYSVLIGMVNKYNFTYLFHGVGVTDLPDRPSTLYSTTAAASRLPPTMRKWIFSFHAVPVHLPCGKSVISSSEERTEREAPVTEMSKQFKKRPPRKRTPGKRVAVSAEARQAYEQEIKARTERESDYQRHLPARDPK